LIWEYDAGGLILGLQRNADRVYIATRPGEVISISDNSTAASYGGEVWTQSLNAGIRDAGLAKAGDILYTGTISEPGTVYAIDVTDGSVISSQQLFSGFITPIITDDGAVWTAGAGRSPGSTETDPSYVYKLAGQGNGNTQPSPSFTVTPVNPAVDESVDFDASGSTDTDGTIQQYEWDVDDDSKYELTGEQATFSFSSSGEVSIMLRVTDDTGATATTEETITVGDEPSLPSNLRRFDTNSQPGIQSGEVVDAIIAYNTNGQIGSKEVTRGDVVDLIIEYNSQ
jgi:hypothetical protein